MPGFGNPPCKRTDSHPIEFGNTGDAKPSRNSVFSSENCTVPRALAALLIVVALILCFHNNGAEAPKMPIREVTAVDEALFKNMEERRLLLRGPAPAKGFYLDIGSSAEKLRNSQRAPHLEKLGYAGICAIPLAGDIGDRLCRQVVLPVAPNDEEKVNVPDCRGVVRAEKSMFQESHTDDCPEVSLQAVGISTLLHRVAAPPVIDYFSLETHGSELKILQSFPFEQHCVRAWAVSLTQTDSDTIPIIRQILEVSHGCRIREGYNEFWARCPCKDSTAAAAAAEKGSSNPFLPIKEKEKETKEKETISE